jgi:hypothetical protein
LKTRGVQAGVATRIASETVTLEYNDEYDNGDGSATPLYTEVVSGASVGALQPYDIERLELAGIKVKNGVTIVLPFSLNTIPNSVLVMTDEYEENKRYRIVAPSIANGISVLTGDLIPIGPAE